MARAELITQAAYARRRGCDPTSVRDAVKAGRITLIDGKIEPGPWPMSSGIETHVRASATGRSPRNRRPVASR